MYEIGMSGVFLSFYLLIGVLFGWYTWKEYMSRIRIDGIPVRRAASLIILLTIIDIILVTVVDLYTEGIMLPAGLFFIGKYLYLATRDVNDLIKEER